MTQEVKVKLWVETGYSGANHYSEDYIEKQVWDNSTPEQRERMLQEIAKDYLHNCIDYGAYVEEDEI